VAGAIVEAQTRSEALSEVAAGLARGHRYREARSVGAHCGDLADRLHVQAEVVLAKAIRDRPGQREAIQEVRAQDWEGGGS
jgi:hypothetical protein